MQEKTIAQKQLDLANAPSWDAFMAMGHAWPTTEVLRKLVLAAEHLATVHDCDVHGWEEIRTAAALGRERLKALGIELPEAEICSKIKPLPWDEEDEYFANASYDKEDEILIECLEVPVEPVP